MVNHTEVLTTAQAESRMWGFDGAVSTLLEAGWTIELGTTDPIEYPSLYADGAGKYSVAIRHSDLWRTREGMDKPVIVGGHSRGISVNEAMSKAIEDTHRMLSDYPLEADDPFRG